MTDVLTNAETYFANIATTIEDAAKPVFSSFLTNFIETDLGKLAVDAVNYADTWAQQTASTSTQTPTSEEKQEAAKTQLLNDAEAAGHDLSTAATSFVNFLIETALQAVLAGAVTAVV